MIASVVLFVASLAFVHSWMPHERNMTAGDGNDLFEANPNTNVERRWLPAKQPIRGVSVGSMFIIEPWMAKNAWNNVDLYYDHKGPALTFDKMLSPVNSY